MHLYERITDTILALALERKLKVQVRRNGHATACFNGRINGERIEYNTILVDAQVVPHRLPHRNPHRLHLAIFTKHGPIYAVCHDQTKGNGSSKLDKCEVYMARLPDGKKRCVVSGLLEEYLQTDMHGGVLIVSVEDFIEEVLDAMAN